MKKIIASISLLHELPGKGSLDLQFHGQSVLRYTLDRVARAKNIASTYVSCWEDQLEMLRELTPNAHSLGVRRNNVMIESIAAAQRWRNGWRGGLLDTCDFDQGWDGQTLLNLCEAQQADGVMLVGASYGLVDPTILDGMIAQLCEREIDFCFTAAAQGLGGMLVAKSRLEKLVTARIYPGKMLHYLPDNSVIDPIAGQNAYPVPNSTQRTVHRFTLDSSRQIARYAKLLANGLEETILSGELASLRQMDSTPDDFPRDVRIEITTKRLTKPIYSPLASHAVERAEMPLEMFKKIIEQLPSDTRVTLGGVGDPLLHPDFTKTVDVLQAAGIRAVCVETDLLDLTDPVCQALCSNAVDIVSVHLPALQQSTYQAVMGYDGFHGVMQNIRTLYAYRMQQSAGVPMIVPLFAKTTSNFEEMEQWYDAWLRALQAAAIIGPSDYSAQITDAAVVDMAPPMRKACERINQRMMILSNGDVTSCENDFAGKYPFGNVAQNIISNVWLKKYGQLRLQHAEKQWNLNVLCSRCRDWHRP